MTDRSAYGRIFGWNEHHEPESIATADRMTPTAILLVLISALIHAGWNLLGKRDGATGAYFGIAGATGFLIVLPAVLVWSDSLVLMPRTVWLYLLFTGFFQGLYFIGLAGAYRTGDLSVAYPVARALPVLMVPAAATFIGTGSAPTPIAVAGMVTVAAGLLALSRNPQSSGGPGGESGGRPGGRPDGTFLADRRWIAYALLAGVGTTGYSVVDDAALSLFRDVLTAGGGIGGDLSGGPGTPSASLSASLRAPIIYAAFQSVATAIFLTLFGVLRAGGTGYLREIRDTSIRSAAAAGLAIVAAYSLVMVAYGFATNVGYVVAFRQVSLPIGTLLGILVLREKSSVTRLVGTALIVSGLVLVSVG